MEIAIISVSTITAVSIMYLHSLAKFGYTPPQWLCTIMMIDCCCCSNKQTGKTVSEGDMMKADLNTANKQTLAHGM
jgi:hypothetical protein